VNEVKAFNFIMNELENIRNSSKNLRDVTIDHQIVNGYNFERAMYKNIQNIVVRLQGQTDFGMSLILHEMNPKT
jgi:hypothetical protein